MMRKHTNLILAIMLGAMTATTSCSDNDNDGPVPAVDYELRTLTFEDADCKFDPYTLDYCNKTISTWSDLIDTPQYGGPLLYNDQATAPYEWADLGNTMLQSSLIDGGPYWNGGEAISNYSQSDINSVDYTRQLAVATLGGYDGSANFAMHNGWDTPLDRAHLSWSFADGQARIIDHMYVTSGAYGLCSLKGGNPYASAATESTWVKIIAVGMGVNGQPTGRSEFYLCRNGKPVTEWQRWELAGLGQVLGVWFQMEASEDQTGEYGLNYPGYFAYDNVTVRFPKK